MCWHRIITCYQLMLDLSKSKMLNFVPYFLNIMAGVPYAVYVCLLFISCTFAKSNIILVLSDDQDLLLGGMTPMTNTVKDIANHGLTFANAFVNSPICCPSRSSLLTGRYPHNTGVWNNSVTGGCASAEWHKHHEPQSVAALLHASGYRTFYAGKYLNQYGTKSSGFKHHVPEGWDHWYGLIGNSKYYNYSLSENGKIVRYTDSYLTDVISKKAVEFLQSESKAPIFMMLAVPAPHAPFTPAPRHRSAFPSAKAHRTPAYNATAAGKHWLLQQAPVPLPTEATPVLDTVQRRRLQSLLSVDELVARLVQELRDSKLLNNTYFIYTSDNAYHIGQFSQPWDKRQPYDTDIRVPLLMRGPGLPAKTITNVVAQTVDVAPTLLDMAGIEAPSYMDGRSLLSDIRNENIQDWKKTNVLIEYQGEGNAATNDPRCQSGNDDSLAECGWDSWCKCQDSRNNTYSCVREMSPQKDFLICSFNDSENFVEAYDLRIDKYQLNNIYKKMKTEVVEEYMALLHKLMKCQGSECYRIIM